jgi:hypothetical protein
MSLENPAHIAKPSLTVTMDVRSVLQEVSNSSHPDPESRVAPQVNGTVEKISERVYPFGKIPLVSDSVDFFDVARRAADPKITFAGIREMDFLRARFSGLQLEFMMQQCLITARNAYLNNKIVGQIEYSGPYNTTDGKGGDISFVITAEVVNTQPYTVRFTVYDYDPRGQTAILNLPETRPAWDNTVAKFDVSGREALQNLAQKVN